MRQRDTDDFQRLLAGTHGDPFSVLGLRAVEGGHSLAVILPGAAQVVAKQGALSTELAAVPDAPGIFEAMLPDDAPYLLEAVMTDGGSLPSRMPTALGPCWAIWTNT
jgi:1,4-alpha-glucan branching enzyme